MYNVKCGGKVYHISHFQATRTEKGLENDVIHYVVSAINRPTIIMRHVFNKVGITINETNICEMKGQGVAFTDDAQKPEYSGVMISNIFPYLDSADDVQLPNNKKHEVFHNQENVLEYFDWKLQSAAVKSSSDPTAVFIGTPAHGFSNKSSLTFQV